MFKMFECKQKHNEKHLPPNRKAKKSLLLVQSDFTWAVLYWEREEANWLCSSSMASITIKFVVVTARSATKIWCVCRIFHTETVRLPRKVRCHQIGSRRKYCELIAASSILSAILSSCNMFNCEAWLLSAVWCDRTLFCVFLCVVVVIVTVVTVCQTVKESQTICRRIVKEWQSTKKFISCLRITFALLQRLLQWTCFKI